MTCPCQLAALAAKRRRTRKIKGTFCKRTVETKRSFAAGSFRWKRSGKAWVQIGCPRGKWGKGRCKVGTRAHVVLKPSKGKCAAGSRRIRKGR